MPDKNSTLDNWLIGLAISVGVLVAVTCAICIGKVFYPSHPSPTIVRVEVTLPDSVGAHNNSFSSQLIALDSISHQITRQQVDLERNYELFMKARQDDADILKIISCVTAMILAILTFFGIHSFKELHEKISTTAITEAKEEANYVAKNAVNGFLKSEVKRQVSAELNEPILISSIVEKADNDVYQKHIQRWEDKLARIEQKIQSIRNNSSSGNAELSDESASEINHANEQDVSDDIAPAVPNLDDMNALNLAEAETESETDREEVSDE